MPLKKSQIEEFKKRLLDLRAEMTKMVKETSEDVKTEAESKGYSQHQADEGTDDFDRTISLQLDPKTKAIGKVEKNDAFPNTELFYRLAKWVRDKTSATPFLIGEKRINQPIRLGKQCFDWVNRHPRLKEMGLYVSRKGPQHAH